MTCPTCSRTVFFYGDFTSYVVYDLVYALGPACAGSSLYKTVKEKG